MRTIDACSLCGAEVEPDADDADGPCCAGAEVVRSEILSALEATGRDLADEALRLQARQLDACSAATIEDRSAAHRLLVGDLDTVTEARCSVRVAWAWERHHQRGEL